MPKKSKKKRKYDIHTELLHSFFVNCDNVYVKYTDVMDYATQLYILVDAYYETDIFEKEVILNCIERTSEQLYQTVCNVYDMMKVCGDIHSNLVAKN